MNLVVPAFLFIHFQGSVLTVLLYWWWFYVQCMNEHLISLLKQSVFILIAKMFSLIYSLTFVHMSYMLQKIICWIATSLKQYSEVSLFTECPGGERDMLFPFHGGEYLLIGQTTSWSRPCVRYHYISFSEASRANDPSCLCPDSCPRVTDLC